MNEIINMIVSKLEMYVNIPYIVTVILLGYLIKTYFQLILNNIFNRDVKLVFVVLILATLVAIPYLAFGAEWQKILFSYTLATSLHETIFTWIEKRIKKLKDE